MKWNLLKFWIATCQKILYRARKVMSYNLSWHVKIQKTVCITKKYKNALLPLDGLFWFWYRNNRTNYYVALKYRNTEIIQVDLLRLRTQQSSDALHCNMWHRFHTITFPSSAIFCPAAKHVNALCERERSKGISSSSREDNSTLLDPASHSSSILNENTKSPPGLPEVSFGPEF